MPLTGNQVHRQLIQAYEDLGSRIEEEHRQIEQMHAHWESWNEDRLASLEKLAQHYLPELTEEAIGETWAEVRQQLKQVYLRKQDEQLRLSGQLQADETLRHGLEKELQTLSKQVDEVREQTELRTRQAEAALKADSSFVHGSEQAAMAEAALERAEANLEEVSQDAARKLPAYESCRFFRYLRDRQFGTSQYRAGGLTRRLDQMIANFCNFRQAIRDYRFLNETPDTMRRIIAEDRDALHTVLNQLQTIRDRVAEETGLTKQLEALEDLEQKRQQLLEDLEAVSERVEQAATATSQLDDGQGSFYEEAIQIFRRFLQEADRQMLRDRAAATPEIRDDQMVATIRGLDEQLERAKEDAESRRKSVESLQSTQAAAGRLLQRFRASGFDSAGIQFPDDLNVADRVGGADHPDQVEAFWQALRRQQRAQAARPNAAGGSAANSMSQLLSGAMAEATMGDKSEHARRAGTRHRPRPPA